MKIFKFIKQKRKINRKRKYGKIVEIKNNFFFDYKLKEDKKFKKKNSGDRFIRM